MRRYQFALAAAMRVRRAQEDAARQRLAAANAEVRGASAALAAAIDERGATAVITGPVDVAAFRSRRFVEERMAERIERARRALAASEVAAVTCYAGWVEAAKAVASLERLDDRRLAEWRAGLLHEESAAIDDVVASRWTAGASSHPGIGA